VGKKKVKERRQVAGTYRLPPCGWKRKEENKRIAPHPKQQGRTEGKRKWRISVSLSREKERSIKRGLLREYNREEKRRGERKKNVPAYKKKSPGTGEKRGKEKKGK